LNEEKLMPPDAQLNSTNVEQSAARPQCIANISREERRKRLLSGAVALLLALVALVVLVLTGVRRWWRLPLFLLFWGAATGFFQWRDST
jgi:fatty acid desaturase